MTPEERKRRFQAFAERYGLVFDDQQVSAACRDGTVLLLAVPGSGKTTTLIGRLGFMTMELGISPRQILAITYTVSGTETMRRSFSDHFPARIADEISFRTINGICWGIVWQYYQNHHREISVCDEKTERKILRQLFQEIRWENYPSENDLIQCQTDISRAKNQMLTDAEIQAGKWKTDSFQEIYAGYAQKLKELRMADYDDQMIFALKILRADPSLKERIHSRYRYILVDEAQDTSLLQHEILHELKGKDGSLFLVGDEDQSIYGYRGACPGILLKIDEQYPGAEIMKLENNYRSHREITDTAQRFIDRSAARLPKRMHAYKGEGGRVVIHSVKSRSGQREALLQYCKEAAAVLYRNNDSAVCIIDILERNGIPWVLNKPKDTFFTSAVTNEVKSFFQFALDPDNPELLNKVYSRFSLYFTSESVCRAERFFQRNHKSLLDEFADSFLFGKKGKPDRMAQNAKKFRDVFQRVPALSPSEALDQMLSLGYKQYLMDHERGMGGVEILSMIADGTKTAREFLARLDLLQKKMQEKRETQSAVFLSTIHSAKGMEFERVILYDVTDGILPAVTAEEKEQYEEERRLFYVGMTRAEKELVVLSVRGNGKTSSFPDELRMKKNPEKKQKPSGKKKKSGKIHHAKVHSLVKPMTELQYARDKKNADLFQIHKSEGKITEAWKIDPASGELTPCTEYVQRLYRKGRIERIKEEEKQDVD